MTADEQENPEAGAGVEFCANAIEPIFNRIDDALATTARGGRRL
jgi:hypothetical protein